MCCTYSNGPVSFNLCEKGGVCPVLNGYKLLKSVDTPSCSVCTASTFLVQPLTRMTSNKHGSGLTRTHGCCLRCTDTILCCTYSNGPVSFNLCEFNGACPVLIGYTLAKSIPTSSCSACTGSNNAKTQVETQTNNKIRVK